MTFDGIPEQVARDKHVGTVPENRLQAPLYRDDPLELLRVVRHGLTVAVWIVDLGFDVER